MPVPKQHASRKRTGDRRIHLTLKPMSLAICSHCKATMIPHRVCAACGYYRGKSVITMKNDSPGRTKSKNDKEEELMKPSKK